MAIAPETSALEIPTNSAVSRFTVERLGASPTLSVTFAETVPDMLDGSVVAMLEHADSAPGALLYSGIDVLFPVILDGSFVGLDVRRVPDDSLVGVVATSDVRTLTFVDPLTTDLTAEKVRVQRRNPFGVPALRKAKDTTERMLTLRTGDPVQFQRMAAVMITAHVRAVLAVLPGLGVERAPDAVQTAVLGALDNLESILASEFEQLELERRAETFVGSVREG